MANWYHQPKKFDTELMGSTNPIRGWQQHYQHYMQQRIYMRIFRQHLVPCETLLLQTKVKTKLETSQKFGVEAGMVLEEVTVKDRIVAGAVDTDVEARTIVRKRNYLPRVTLHKNGDSSCMSRKSLCRSLDGL